jgi:hypothetical protein
MEQGFNFNIYNVQEVSRVEFIRKTYAHVALAVLAFVGFEYLLLNSEIGVNIGMRMANNWIIVLVLFMGGSWIANKWAVDAGNVQKQYLGLFVYSLLMLSFFYHCSCYCYIQICLQEMQFQELLVNQLLLLEGFLLD